jgi:hypothetical protein
MMNIYVQRLYDMTELLNNEFSRTSIKWEMYDDNYYIIYYKNKKNCTKDEFKSHELKYFTNTLDRVKSDVLYNLMSNKK